MKTLHAINFVFAWISSNIHYRRSILFGKWIVRILTVIVFLLFYSTALSQLMLTATRTTSVLEKYEAKYNYSTPFIDGQVNEDEWINANLYNITYIRNDGNGTSNATLYLQNDGTWLYIGIITTIDAGWDVYHQIRFDGNHDHILSGDEFEPHTDIQIEHASPEGWPGYTGYYYINSNSGTNINPPIGTESESYAYSDVNYEYKVSIADLNTVPGEEIGMYFLNGTDGTSAHGYEFPVNGCRTIPNQWAHVLIAPESIYEYTAKYDDYILPLIDGQVNEEEWSSANIYTVKYKRNDGNAESDATLYLQHDGTWLYIGLITNIDAGWDVYHQIRFDGNHDHLLSGDENEPHTDIQIEHASPVGWPGYNGYYYISSNSSGAVEAPNGTDMASYGFLMVNYEYKVKLSDLNTSIGETLGFYFLNGTDGSSGHDYEFPSNGLRFDATQWANMVLAPIPDSYYTAKLNYNSHPTIDGKVNEAEWSNANLYNITYTRNDGNAESDASLYLQHDGTWLYIGLITNIDAGWDVYHQIRFDGNHDHLLSGGENEPHTDIQIEHASPSGWSGYNGYYYIFDNSSGSAEAPAGTMSESDGLSMVNYEYKVKLSDLNTSTGETLGFYMLNGIDGTSEHDFEFPFNGLRYHQENWSHIWLCDTLPIGINENNNLTLPIVIYPNPVTTELNIVLTNAEDLYIKIYNSCGQRLYSEIINSKQFTIDFSRWRPGLYILEIIDPTSGSKSSYKIIKK